MGTMDITCLTMDITCLAMDITGQTTDTALPTTTDTTATASSRGVPTRRPCPRLLTFSPQPRPLTPTDPTLHQVPEFPSPRATSLPRDVPPPPPQPTAAPPSFSREV